MMQLILDSSTLVINSFITRKLGASAIGILSLMGSFLGLAGILSNGNAFLCTNRLISEEIGKKNGNPNRVLAHGIKLCGILSIAVSAIVLSFSEIISRNFFGGTEMIQAVRMMPAALVTGAVSACFKGYFNAMRKSLVTAIGDICEFAVKSGIIVFLTLTAHEPDGNYVCRIMILSIIAGNIFSLFYLLVAFAFLHEKSEGRCTLTMKRYITFAIPIMGGSLLTAVLGSTNDALIPICLRQYGDSASESLSLFGIFEGIVMPALFFPSVVLCSMTGIIVSESARARAMQNKERMQSLTSRLTGLTLYYSIFCASVILKFGMQIGEILGGGETAGGMIRFIAPVVPFIYLEIILEALIKGMGLQGFSSLNYLAEYVIRISIVLILVPHIGFYGIAFSYYASNIFGNVMRLIKIMKSTETCFKPIRMIVYPAVCSFLTMNGAELLTKLYTGDKDGIVYIVMFTAIWILLYGGLFLSFRNKKSGKLFVGNAQQTA